MSTYQRVRPSGEQRVNCFLCDSDGFPALCLSEVLVNPHIQEA